MKRIRKRLAGVVVGLVLGWLAQGYAFEFLATQEAQASPTTQHVTEEGSVQTESTHSHNHAGAEHLVPHQQGRAWFAGISAGVLGLFALALIVGIPASRFVSQPPAEDDHDDHHDEPLHRHTLHH